MHRSLWTAFAFVLFAGLVVGIIHWRRLANATTDVTKVGADLRDHLPPGSSRAAVTSYLDQRGIQHSFIDQSKETPAYNHTELAMIRGASRVQLVTADIQIIFKFDEHDRLLSHSVREIFTGP